MIRKIQLADFKCFTNMMFSTAPLTLLTGTNSVGKSSVLQSLLLFRLATLSASAGEEIISLNGPYGLNLGAFDDILRHDVSTADIPTIGMSITEEHSEYRITLTGGEVGARYARVQFSGDDLPGSLSVEGLGEFVYLSSDRFGPRLTSEVQSVPKESLELDYRGEHTADLLSRCERDEVVPELEHPKAPGQRLLKQTEAWLSSFVPGVEIRVEPAPDLDLATIRFKRGGVSSEWERPANTGYGVSYCLPIVVAGLTAQKGSILIVESPEAHLHSSAQSEMGSFLARLAASGVQVLIETHSDHILNGIRKAAVQIDHPLSHKDVIVNHLSLENQTVHKDEIRITETGSLTSWPRTFFDQAEIDIGAIVKSRFPDHS